MSFITWLRTYTLRPRGQIRTQQSSIALRISGSLSLARRPLRGAGRGGLRLGEEGAQHAPRTAASQTVFSPQNAPPAVFMRRSLRPGAAQGRAGKAAARGRAGGAGALRGRLKARVGCPSPLASAARGEGHDEPAAARLWCIAGRRTFPALRWTWYVAASASISSGVRYCGSPAVSVKVDRRQHRRGAKGLRSKRLAASSWHGIRQETPFPPFSCAS